MSAIYQKLKPIIDEYYQVFAYPKPSALHNICYPCCVSQEVVKDLITLPLKQLGQTHLYDYNTSAKDRVEIPSEIKYFLPRLIELLAQGESLDHSVELYFERVGHCPDGSFCQKNKLFGRNLLMRIWTRC